MAQESIVNYKELAKILKISPESLKKNWKKYPHFYPLSGTDLRGARFDVNDVMKFLKDENYEQTTEIPNEVRNKIPGEISPFGHPGGQGRLQKLGRCPDLGKAGTAAVKSAQSGQSVAERASSDSREDHFDLLRLIK